MRTVRQIPPATPSGFDFLFRTRPRALWQQTPPEPVLILQTSVICVDAVALVDKEIYVLTCHLSPKCMTFWYTLLWTRALHLDCFTNIKTDLLDDLCPHRHKILSFAWPAISSHWALTKIATIMQIVFMRKTTRFSSTLGFSWQIPPYGPDWCCWLCSLRVSEVWLACVHTLNPDHLFALDIFVISSQNFASGIRQCNCIHYDQTCLLYCQ